MSIIQQIVVSAVEEIIKKLQNAGMNDIGKTIKELQPVVSNTVLSIISSCIEEMDKALVIGAKAMRREDGITIKESHVNRTLTTELGDLKYHRTYFQLHDGTYAYLLDHIIGVEGYERISKELVASILEASTVKSYQQAVNATGRKITRQTVHNRLIALNDLTVDVHRIAETPETVDVFADEDHAHLTPKGSAIVPLVTVTEGINQSDPKRHKTIHPLHIGAYGMQQAAFDENVLAVLTERYDLEKVKQINIHADGGNWIQGLQKVIPQSRLVMDGFHLEKRIKSFLRLEGAKNYAGTIRRLMSQEDGYEKLEKICETIYSKQPTLAAQQKVAEFLDYCATHWSAIVPRMKKETCGSCTEPLVSHVLSDRISRNPIAWSRQGLSKMTMLVVYCKNGGHICSDDVRIRVDDHALSSFREDGYSKYRDYAMKQADEVLNVKHDWSLFDHECSVFGKVDGPFLIRKSLGSLKPLSALVS